MLYLVVDWLIEISDVYVVYLYSFIDSSGSLLLILNTYWKFDWLVNTVVIVLNQDDKDELLCSEVETDVLWTIVVLKWEKRNYHPLKKSDC